MYYANKFKEYTKQSKIMWQLITVLTNHCSNKKHVIEHVNVNDISYFNPKDIANQFVQYFSTIGNNLSSNIKQSHKQISDYISKILNNNRTLFMPPCTQNEIFKLIDQLPNKTI